VLVLNQFEVLVVRARLFSPNVLQSSCIRELNNIATDARLTLLIHNVSSFETHMQ